MNEEFQIRLDIVECGRRIYARNYVASNDGNISVRVGDRIIATPTGISKGFMRAEDMVVLDMQGRVIEGACKPSTEIKMHLAIYEERKDVNSVVHAHPVHATGFATAQIELKDCVLAEIVTTLGSIPLAPYATPSTTELPDSVRPIIRHADACLLANHGVVTCGRDVYDAYYKLERVEHYAHILFVAKSLGGAKILSPQQVHKLETIRATYGTSDAHNPGCIACHGACIGSDCTLYETQQRDQSASDLHVEETVRAIISAKK